MESRGCCVPRAFRPTTECVAVSPTPRSRPPQDGWCRQCEHTVLVEDEAGERVVSNAEKEGFEVRVRLCNGVVPFDAAGGSTITLAPKPEDEDEEGDDDDSPMSSRDNYV